MTIRVCIFILADIQHLETILKIVNRFIWFQPSREETCVSHESPSAKTRRRRKDGSSSSSGSGSGSGTSSTVNAFRQWRRSASAGNRSNPTRSNSTALTQFSNDPATLHKLEHFPLVLSDATMPEEDLSLKFLALVYLFYILYSSLILIRVHANYFYFPISSIILETQKNPSIRKHSIILKI